MPTYQYIARKIDGKTVKGHMYANNIRDLHSGLKMQNLKLIKGKVYKQKEPNVFLSVRSKVKRQEVITFIRQLSVMVSAGVRVVESIDILRKQVSSKAFQKVLISVYNDLLKGVFLSDAFAKHPKVFPAFFKNMVYIGEISGSLDYVLNNVADYYEHDLKIKQKAKNALTYPMILMLMVVAVFIFLTVYIIPQFEVMLSELGGELPQITVIVVGISRYMKSNFIQIIGSIVISIISVLIFFKTKPGRYVKDYLKLKLPLLKSINYSLITSRFSRGLGVLVGSGMSVMDSIESIGKLMDNKVFEKKFEYATAEVKRGKMIARSIDNMNFFPKMLSEMVLVGETTGSLTEVLQKTSSYYDDQLEKTIVKVTTALEPILIIFAGGVIAVVILSIFLPMMSIMDSI